MRKALLVGINYIGTRNRLNGCINDINNIGAYLFSVRKYKSIKSGTNVIGFMPELYFYYNGLCKLGPLSHTVDCPSNLNSWIMGAIIIGSVGFLTVLLSDGILYYLQNK